MRQKLKKVLLVLAALLLIFVIWTVWGNVTIKSTEISVSSPKLPASFEGFRIAQVSDLHNAEFGEGNARLLEALKDGHPDIIVITGDLIDSSTPDVELALAFAAQAINIAPVYYVTGNHEARVPADLESLLEGLQALRVNILCSGTESLERDGECILLAGVHDPDFYTSTDAFTEDISALCAQEGYTVLLSHRPERFDDYVALEADLILTGHAHGGQFRLPFVGGLIAPHQGIFPKYDAGSYEENGTTMIVSRGLGNSAFPFRINNRPEVVFITLHT